MTTRKLNMIKKYTYLDGQTFTEILQYVESVMNIERLTAKQVADIINICKAQSEYGYNQCWQENFG